MNFIWLWELDGWIIVAGILCSVAASLLGTFLVLRRMSLLGDAISHAVLPGLAAAFLISGSRNSVAMFIGAVIVGVLTALATQWIRNYGNVDEGASMGVVFTSLFALGLLMIVQAADHVDLDPSCVLYGAIEFTPLDQWNLFGFYVPRVVVILSVVCLLNLLFVVGFYKELKLSSFDPALATTSGFNSSVIHYALMTMIAITTVASFESVGNILVIAMMIVPAAAALILSERLWVVLVISVVIAIVASIMGHLSAVVVPAWFDYRSTRTASMMAVSVGVIFLFVSLFAPKNGLVIRHIRNRALSIRILMEDIVAAIYRDTERGGKGLSIPQLQEFLMSSRWSLMLATWKQRRAGNIAISDGYVSLTDKGTSLAKQLVRSHRLWEHYLADQASVPAGRTHAKAERLEHFTDSSLRARLEAESNSPKTDPHGREIPGD